MLLLSAMAYATTPTPASISKTAAHHPSRKHHSRKRLTKSHGQQKIDPERAEQIQKALIREHYLDGEATGVWNDACQLAMQRYQASNGWQTKVVPDSRALIKLGLGPDHNHLLNPESAMTSPPQLSPRTSDNAPVTQK